MVMRLKDLVSVVKNKNNKQINLNLKKKRLKDLDISEEEILNIHINLGKLRLKDF
ncbi:MAG TPA: hypothetical protein VMZ91_16030 [Candidatus Paceibacterota bacterium]|nr:hypothetical protein [Candidatus Paceibacterota bacterium]